MGVVNIMIQIFGLMVLLGGFLFIGFGACVASSIEAKQSEKVANVMSALTVVGILSFITGIIGLYVVS